MILLDLVGLQIEYFPGKKKKVLLMKSAQAAALITKDAGLD